MDYYSCPMAFKMAGLLQHQFPPHVQHGVPHAPPIPNQFYQQQQQERRPGKSRQLTVVQNLIVVDMIHNTFLMFPICFLAVSLFLLMIVEPDDITVLSFIGTCLQLLLCVAALFAAKKIWAVTTNPLFLMQLERNKGPVLGRGIIPWINITTALVILGFFTMIWFFTVFVASNQGHRIAHYLNCPMIAQVTLFYLLSLSIRIVSLSFVKEFRRQSSFPLFVIPVGEGDAVSVPTRLMRPPYSYLGKQEPFHLQTV